MAKIKTRDQLYINYSIFGNLGADETQTIFMAHGNGNRLDDWVTLGYIESLSEFRVIAMDAIGYGSSDKPYIPERYSSEERAKDVIDLLDGLNINRCHFWGNSIGGSLGYVLATQYPERFYSFAIGSAHPYGSTRECSNLFPKGFLESLKSTQDLVDVIEAALDAEQRKFIPALKETFLANDLHALVAANQLDWPDYSAKLLDIRTPVLLYAGQKDPVYQHVAEYATDHHDVTLLTLENRTHADVYWNGAEITHYVKEFITKILINLARMDASNTRHTM